MADMFAVPLDLGPWLQRTITEDDDTARVALETATGWIQAEIGQRIVRVTETVTLSAGRTPSLWLPERPVVSVGAVTTTDYRGTVTARTLNTHYYVVGGEIRWASNLWAGRPGLATVTYTHGYATVPEAIRGVCLAAAARAYENATSLRSETVGGVSWTNAGAAEDLGPGLSGSERTSLAPYRQLVVA